MKRGWVVLFLPMALMVLGLSLNQMALWSNGGFMPVLAPGGCNPHIPDWNHTCMTAQTHLKFLGDWIVANGGLSSIGDFLEDASEHLVIPSILTWLTFVLKALLEKK